MFYREQLVLSSSWRDDLRFNSRYKTITSAGHSTVNSWWCSVDIDPLPRWGLLFLAGWHGPISNDRHYHRLELIYLLASVSTILLNWSCKNHFQTSKQFQNVTCMWSSLSQVSSIVDVLQSPTLFSILNSHDLKLQAGSDDKCLLKTVSVKMTFSRLRLSE